MQQCLPCSVCVVWRPLPKRKCWQKRSNACSAGVIFWQWGFAPYIAEEFLQGCRHCQAIQVSASDGVFKNIIAPAAEYAAQVAVDRSPVPKCKPGMGCQRPSCQCQCNKEILYVS